MSSTVFPGGTIANIYTLFVQAPSTVLYRLTTSTQSSQQPLNRQLPWFFIKFNFSAIVKCTIILFTTKKLKYDISHVINHILILEALKKP